MTHVRPELAVVVLNWNNAEDSLECLASLAASDEPLHAIVVDNGSVDGSADLLEESGLAAYLLRTGENLGYAGGNNVGVQYALNNGYSTIAVLNNDTLVDPRAMGGLRRHAEAPGQALAVSPLIAYAGAGADEELWFAQGVIDRGWPRHVQSHEVQEAAGVLRQSEILTGCCIAARSDVWREVGGFDESFFLIFEDSDWSVRAHRKGVRLVVATDCLIQHKVSRSFTQGGMPALGTYYFVRNGLRFSWRHSRRHLLRFLVMWVLRPTARRLTGRRTGSAVPFAWLGVASAAIGLDGSAPTFVARRAEAASRPRPSRPPA